jgi:hypothetical protein
VVSLPCTDFLILLDVPECQKISCLSPTHNYVRFVFFQSIHCKQQFKWNVVLSARLHISSLKLFNKWQWNFDIRVHDKIVMKDFAFWVHCRLQIAPAQALLVIVLKIRKGAYACAYVRGTLSASTEPPPVCTFFANRTVLEMFPESLRLCTCSGVARVYSSGHVQPNRRED